MDSQRLVDSGGTSSESSRGHDGGSVHMFAGANSISLRNVIIKCAAAGVVPIVQEKDDIDELREIADWLTPINFRSIHNDTFSKHTPGTGVRFLESDEFRRWLSTSCETLWVTGMPGAGKTILLSVVVDHLQTLHSSSHEVAVILSCCRYTNQYSVEDLLSSFIKQLLERHPSVFPDVQSFYRAHKRDATRPTRRKLHELFQNLCGHPKAVYICIDALDEVSDDTKWGIIDVVASFSWANVFLTSRPLDAFKYLLPKARCLRLDPRDDIELFILKHLKEAPRLKGILNGNESLIREIMETLRTKSEGMFLVVSLQIEKLKEAITLKNLRAILESLPTGVHDMYIATVARIESQSGDASSLAMRAILWLTYAFYPLTIMELRHALAISNDEGIFDLDDVAEESLLVSVCCGLVVVDQEMGVIRLAHYTAHDFFKTLTTGVFARPHTFITESCMVYLSDITNFGQISYLDELRNVLFRLSHHLLHYVYHYWCIHARSCRREGEIPTALSAFFLRCGPYPWRDSNISFDRFELPHVAICYGLSEFLPQILQAHDKPTAEGRLPLQLCAMYGRDMIMRALVECHPKILNIKDRQGNTALVLACHNGHESVVKLLLSYDDIDVNSQDDGEIPLLLAVKNGNLAITQLLVSHHRLNPDQRQRSCFSMALILASEQGHEEIVRVLLSRNDIDVNSQDLCGGSALARAAQAQQQPKSARATSKAPAYGTQQQQQQGRHPSPPTSKGGAGSKGRGGAGAGEPTGSGTGSSAQKGKSSANKIWSTSPTEERERIKDFWFGLGEQERRNMVKIEKDTALRKMKEQLKHSCSCAVCGMKRNAIEEELEALYDAYYEKLEQYANYQQRYVSSGRTIPPLPGPGTFPGSLQLDKNGAAVAPGPPLTNKQHRSRTKQQQVAAHRGPPPQALLSPVTNDRKQHHPTHIHPHHHPPPSKESEFEDGEQEEEDYDGEEYEEEAEEEPEDGLFNIGSSLTVTGPGIILTVDDDLLMKDGQKFLEMMEQLAEPRMQRQELAANVEDDSDEDSDEDWDRSEGDEDDDGGASDEDDKDDEDEDDEEIMTEEQKKMEEGKRMFSIFAARMLEQRVLQSYQENDREKVAQERQIQLLRQLDEECCTQCIA